MVPVRKRQIVNLWADIADPESWRQANRDVRALMKAFGPRYPYPGFMGSNYESRHIVILGQNSGDGRGFEERDKILFNHTLKLAETRTQKSYQALMEYSPECMLEWTIFRKWGIFGKNADSRGKLGIALKDVAYFNVLHVNQDDRLRSTESHLNPLYEFAISNFTSRQLSLLRPRAILILGKHGKKMLDTFWHDKPDDLPIKVIWHPSSNYAHKHRDEFIGQLDQARQFIIDAMNE